MHEKTRKKILYLITKSDWGGAQRYVFDLAVNLNPADFDVAVALGGTGKLREELERKRVRTVPIESLQRDISLIREVKTFLELLRIVKDEKPDILHINSSKAGGLGGLIGRLLRVPRIIFTAHGWAFNENRPRWQKIIIKFLHWVTILLSHTTIAVSETTKKQMPLPFVTRKVRVIHNGRTVSEFLVRDSARAHLSDILPRLRKFRSDFWSVTIAELHHVKQNEVSIHALKRVVLKHPNVRHIIIGDGEERERLEALVSSLGLGKHVFFTGAILEAARYLKAFDLFILASKSEALAYVIIEACLAGLPIVASRVGGIPEIVTDEVSGLLFQSGDVAALAKKLERICEDQNLRESLGNEAKKRANGFTLEKMLHQTQELY